VARTPAPERVVVHISPSRGEVLTDVVEVLRGLRAVWRTCSSPVVAVQQAHVIETRHEEERTVVLLDGEEVDHTDARAHLLPVVERVIYGRVTEWTREAGCVQLHCATLYGEDTALVFLGQSGAGKSSTAWRGIQRGYGYGGDEVAFTDGRAVWGMPRAVLFDPTLVGNTLPEIAAEADRTSYTFPNYRSDPCFIPLCTPPADQLRGEPAPIPRTHVVLLEHGGDPSFGRASTLDVLAALHREAQGSLGSDLAEALLPSHCWHLRWQDLDWAWDRIEAEICRPPRPHQPPQPPKRAG
jgi:hypothetical protein